MTTVGLLTVMRLTWVLVGLSNQGLGDERCHLKVLVEKGRIAPLFAFFLFSFLAEHE